MERSSLVLPASHFRKKTHTAQFSTKPFDRRSRMSKPGVVAAISEDLVKTLRLTTTTGDRKSEEEEKAAVKFKVRAVVTVRNKSKEDFKETLAKHLDAFADKIGRNIALELISTEIDPIGPVHFPCNSWVQSQKDHPEKRIFFTNQSSELSRPKLGGKKIPYPRRCRTGRHSTETDKEAESRVEKPLPMYVPRDEQFEETKQDTFAAGRLKAVLHHLVPSLKASILAEDFADFGEIDALYKEGLLLKLGFQDEIFNKFPLPKVVVNTLQESSKGLLKYDTPKILSKDKNAWLRDDEFARQAIAGINPVNIERVKTFPPVSNLDPEIYGPQHSALTSDHIVGHLDGMSVQQALEENRLYMLDYHDIYLPFLDRINALDGRKAYATRTIFFMTRLGTLKPVAIELSLPSHGKNHRSKRVVTPPVDATSNWVWQLAKAHVSSNDAGVHQLVTDTCVLGTATERMHPIFKLLDPHMRYTLEINALARQSLISADGVIEGGFTAGSYGMEMSAAAYKSSWRFDMEGLPADLVRRGVAVPDATQPHGIKLLIEDYPYANDGLLLWSAIQTWVRTYVGRYYPNPNLIQTDSELQSWYSESINVGHADLRDAEWWPELNTVDDLVSIITTIIWLASAQHAALNFGQYPYGGYVPNRPPLMRRLIPDESDPEYASFISDPERFYFSSMPSLLQTSKFMAVVDTLSTHSPDEEYIGERQQPSIWTGDAEIVDAFYGFAAEIGRIEKEIEKRNSDPDRRNRCGAGVLPYELLVPSSEPGVTCRGVPNSVSI
ncbi:unnamed protein product [Thlaspi arvense]|uniref:Lipoxygenase n=1 Tax=Thlaspi arvense TaxID=13288 RepID=A0AAU9RAG1_THLAR|nr:unnamed protein product [Thlaspi arvense]